MRWCLPLFMLISGTLPAQQYIPLLGDSNRWHVTTCCLGADTRKATTGKDTLYNGKLYKEFNDAYWWYSGLIREDTATQQVWYVSQDSMVAYPDSADEYLLYDFSLQTNDSVYIQVNSWQSNQWLHVDSIGTMQTIVGPRKALYLSTAGPFGYPVAWVEEVGSLAGVLFPTWRWYGPFPGETFLACHFRDGIHIYKHGWVDTLGTCDIWISSVPEHQYLDHIRLSPNPTTGTVRIEGLQGSARITVLDVMGRAVLSTTKTTLDLGLYPAGLYFVRVETARGTVTWKVIKH